MLTSFLTKARRGRLRTVVKTRIRQDLLDTLEWICFYYTMVQYSREPSLKLEILLNLACTSTKFSSKRFIRRHVYLMKCKNSNVSLFRKRYIVTMKSGLRTSRRLAENMRKAQCTKFSTSAVVKSKKRLRFGIANQNSRTTPSIFLS